VASGGNARSLRRAIDDDAGAVVEVWLRSRNASVPAIPPPAHSDEEVRAWIVSLVIPTCDTWVVEEAGEIVALLVIDSGWIDQLYVDPSRIRQGLGSWLVDFAKSQSESRPLDVAVQHRRATLLPEARLCRRRDDRR
jgi:GNAT superfamily N-acetyltransferase